jgi:hypothetical protein
MDLSRGKLMQVLDLAISHVAIDGQACEFDGDGKPFIPTPATPRECSRHQSGNSAANYQES